ncbi:Ubp3 associated protein Bre5 [compost metagenome]
MIGAFVWALQVRPLVSLDVTRDRGLFRENAAGEIENIYSLKLINKTQQPQRYRLSLADAAGYRLQGELEQRLEPGEIRDFAVSVAQLGDSSSGGPAPLQFHVRDVEKPEVQVSTASTFVSPRR